MKFSGTLCVAARGNSPSRWRFNVPKSTSVIGALLLSVSCGLLLEEMLFGGLVRLFFARRPESREDKERKLKGERPCLR